MALQPIQGVTERWKEDGDGDMALVIAPLATIEIRDEVTGALTPLFAERDGLSGLDNPLPSDEYGRFSCYTATARVKIVVTTAAGEIGLFRNVPLPQLDLSGTWTPVVSDAAGGGNLAGLGVNTAGYYERVGDLVFLTFAIFDIDTTGLSAANTLHVQGLPFRSKNYAGSPRATSAVQANQFLKANGMYTHIDPNALYMFFKYNQDGTGLFPNNVLVSDVNSGNSDILGSIVYVTEDA